MNTRFIYPIEKYFKSFHEALGSVASEHIFIEMIEPPPFEKVAQFQKNLIEKNGPVYYAIEDQQVVGWCDIFPIDNPRLSHSGVLGMGLIKSHRGQGLGSQLLRATLDHAKNFGLEKIELNVYTSNINAIALYEKFGFEREGLIRRYRKLNGREFDCLTMGKFL